MGKRVTSTESTTASWADITDDIADCDVASDATLDADAQSPTVRALVALFDYSLPEGIKQPVKNTFIHYSLPLDGVSERRVRSAPGSFCSSEFVLAEPVAVPRRQRSSKSKKVQITPAMLSILGTPELPTLGSAGHSVKKCKPCAFAWKDQGCQSGADCAFCHLCDSDEKKSRRKAKLEQRRTRRLAQSQAQTQSLHDAVFA